MHMVHRSSVWRLGYFVNFSYMIFRTQNVSFKYSLSVFLVFFVVVGLLRNLNVIVKGSFLESENVYRNTRLNTKRWRTKIKYRTI